MNDDIQEDLELVREEMVDPSPEELAALDNAVEALTERAYDAAKEFDVDIEVTQTGSTARGTFVSGDRDIDLFLEFPPETDTDTLRSVGLDIGEEILPDARRDYAAHPYTKGTFDEFEVDVVPCFAVADPSNLRSAVDRTPHHTRFLEEELTDELAADVRVAKQFLKGIGAYGSDVATGGFSGFLTELLVLEHDGVVPLLEAAADWTIPVSGFDPGSHQIDGVGVAASMEFDAPLVVIDPTDPTRNVAAALNEENLGRFILNARQYLDEPSLQFFKQTAPDVSVADAIQNATRSGMTYLAVLLDRPEHLVEDTFIPQLRKTRQSLVTVLEHRGFEVSRATEFANAECGAILVALEVAERAAFERHEGPPVDIAHADKFLDKYEADESVIGPFIDGGRLAVEREREFRSAHALLTSDSLREDVAVGASISQQFRDRGIEQGQDALRATAQEFPTQFLRFVDPQAVANRA